jgi:hypothetical protein
MKKLIGALALAAMVATSAFAEVSFGAWVCNLPTLIASDGDGIKGGAVSNPWGWGARPARADINFTSDDGKAGMILGVYADFAGGVAGSSDNTLLWVKPIDQIQLSLGKHDNFFGTRSDLCYGSWNWLRPNTALAWGEGITFSSASDKNGLGLQIMPVEALKIFAMIPLNAVSGESSNAVDTLDQIFGKGRYGATYAIDGIGTIKAQFLANWTCVAEHGATAAGWYDKNGKFLSDQYNDAVIANKGTADLTWQKAGNAAGASKKYGTIEAAFDLTAVDKLFATFGVGFTMTDDSKNNNIKIALGASYGITEAFKLAGDFSINIPGDSDKKPTAGFGVGLDYALTDALGLVADVRMLMPFDTDAAGSLLSFLVGANYAVGSNASLGLGFQAIVGLKDTSPAGDLKLVKAATVDGELKKFIFAVPIRASVWF